jgi:hypothetical protein
MRELETEILAAGEIRRALTQSRDLRGDIEFQNDVNALLARVEHLQMPWRSVSDLSPSPIASAIVADATPLPVVRPSTTQPSKRLEAPIGSLSPLLVARRPVVSARR